MIKGRCSLRRLRDCSEQSSVVEISSGLDKKMAEDMYLSWGI